MKYRTIGIDPWKKYRVLTPQRKDARKVHEKTQGTSGIESDARKDSGVVLLYVYELCVQMKNNKYTANGNFICKD